MMKKFNHPDFQAQLGKLIAELEQSSQIEVVVLIKQSSAVYEDVLIGLGAITSLLTFSYLFYVDTHFNDYFIYLITLASFGAGILLGLVLPFTQRLLTGKKRQERNVEIMARALFQKGGLHHTSTKVGTLIYLSLLEKKVYIVADRGAQMAIPEQEWQKITQDLQSVFKAKNPPESLLKELEKCKNTFSRYIPALENNVNELPNDLQIDL
jgi:putative membrane protein